jgi:four helix bundle protein
MVYEITSIEPFSKDFKFKDQLRDAAVSDMDNIAEGYGRGGNREFINFLSIAKGSNDEVRSQSYRAFDFNYINQDKLDELLERTDKISKKISNFIQYLKKSNLKGPKFND